MNIVLISVDALRPDHLGYHGYERATSPNIDEFAGRSAVFENAVSNAPGTKFAFKPMFTGQYAQEFPDILGIPTDGPATLSELFAEEGYATGGFHSNGFLSEEFHYDRGFETFYGPDTWPTVESSVDVTSVKESVRNRIRDIKPLYRFASWVYDKWMVSSVAPDEDPRPYRTADEVNELVFDWLDDRTGEFFCWVHYMDVHEPYIYREEFLSAVSDRTLTDAEFRTARTPSKVITEEREPTEKEKEDVRALYDAEIRFVDEHIGKLLTRLDDEEETLVVFTADHGESFGEMRGNFHGEAPHWNAIDVPLVINGPGVDSRRVTDYVSHIDVPTTIAEYVNVEPPAHFRGTDLLSAAGNDTPIFVEYLEEWEPAYACIDDGWKYSYEFIDETERLYDLSSDPKEKSNVAAENPDITERFQELLDEHITDYAGGLGEPDFGDLSPSVERNLTNLGYLE